MRSTKEEILDQPTIIIDQIGHSGKGGGMVKRWTHEMVVDHEMRWEEVVADKMNELYFHPNNNLNVIGGNSLYTIRLSQIMIIYHLIYIFQEIHLIIHHLISSLYLQFDHCGWWTHL